MKNYVSPVIFDNEELAEGVYATGSGGTKGSSCWDVEYLPDSTQRGHDGDRFVNFRFKGVHHPTYHISTALKIVITMSADVDSVVFEGFECSWSGSEITLIRRNHANSYLTVDDFNSVMTVRSKWYDTINVVDYKWKCKREENVQNTAGPNGDLVDDYNGLTID